MKNRIDEFSDKDDVTIISGGVIIEGKVSSSGNIRVDGNIKGDIKANGSITIGEGGEVDGQLTGDAITIGGKVKGTVLAKEKLILESKSTLRGDIVSKILVVEAGAKFDGKSSMSEQPKMPLSKPPESSSPPK